MKHYDNGCYRSEITVTPSNWKTQKASIKKKWKIYYRYYDPTMKGTSNWGRMIQIRGMNDEKDLMTRQATTKVLLRAEMERVDDRGFNPITGVYYTPPGVDNVEEITPNTKFIEALRLATKLLKCVPEMKRDVERIVEAVGAAAGKLYEKNLNRPYLAMKINQVTRKHYIYIFKQCAKDNLNFSSNRQNKYRTALIMLYKRLLAVEAVEADPVTSIPIEKAGVKKKPKLLTETERLIIDTNLKAWDYPFWRYMRIFFRSGSRSSEMLDLKPEHVDLEQQEFTITVKKGQEYEEQTRAIPDDVLPLWVEVMEQTKRGEYLFSTSFKPGPVRQYRDAPTKKWNKYVTNDPGKYDPLELGWGLGIKKQFYKLKALNTDTIAGKINIKAAAAMDGHKDVATTKKHYAPNEETRERERLKRTRVDF